MARLSRVSLFGLRNLRRQTVELGADVVIITGDNRQGKTNFLEAIYLGLSARSFRTPKLGEVITFGMSGGWVDAEFTDGTTVKTVLSVSDGRPSVSFFLNEKKIPLKQNPFRMRVFPVLGGDIVNLHRRSVLTKKILQFVLRFDDEIREFYGRYMALRRRRRMLLAESSDERVVSVVNAKLRSVVGPLNKRFENLSKRLNRILLNSLSGMLPRGSVVDFHPHGDPLKIGYFVWSVDSSLLTLGTKMLLLMRLLEAMIEIYKVDERMFLFWDDVGFELDKITLRMLLQQLSFRFQIFWAVPWLPPDVVPTGAEVKLFKVYDGELAPL